MTDDELSAALSSIPLTVDYDGVECRVISATKNWLFALTPRGEVLAQVGRDNELAPFPAEHLVTTLRLADEGFAVEVRARRGDQVEVLDSEDTKQAFQQAFTAWNAVRARDWSGEGLEAEDWSWLWAQEN